MAKRSIFRNRGGHHENPREEARRKTLRWTVVSCASQTTTTAAAAAALDLDAVILRGSEAHLRPMNRGMDLTPRPASGERTAVVLGAAVGGEGTTSDSRTAAAMRFACAIDAEAERDGEGENGNGKEFGESERER